MGILVVSVIFIVSNIVRFLQGGFMKFMDSDIFTVALIVFAVLFIVAHVVLYLTK